MVLPEENWKAEIQKMQGASWKWYAAAIAAFLDGLPPE